MMYSQNDETGVLEVLEIKIFFYVQQWLPGFYQFFKKFFLWILHFGGGITVTFLRE